MPSKPPETTGQALWAAFVGLLVLAALPWMFSAGISYFMLAWRTIP